MPVHPVIDTWMHGGGWVCVNIGIKQTCCPPYLDSKHELSTFHHGCKAALGWWYIPRRGLHIMSTLCDYIESWYNEVQYVYNIYMIIIIVVIMNFN